VFLSDKGDWVSGERGSVFFREGKQPFQAIEHGLPIPPGLSLHTIVVDRSNAVWAAGGNVFSLARDQGLLVHYGDPVPPIDPDVERPAPLVSNCPADVVGIARDKSVARRWDEQALAAIRRESSAAPTLTARNLFHLSAAMWDAWAAYGTNVKPSGVAPHTIVLQHKPEDVEAARREAMSYAAFGILKDRYLRAEEGFTTLPCLKAVMQDLGYDPDDSHVEGDDPAAIGHRIGADILVGTRTDGSNESAGYSDPDPFVSANPTLIFEHPGAPMSDPNAWQPLFLPTGAQSFLTSQWGSVTPFAMKRASSDVPWVDVGPPPRVGPTMKGWIVEVLGKQASELEREPIHSDSQRTSAVLWDEGPSFETLPGYWNVLANQVSDSPALARRLFGKGATVDALSWDVHLYLALNGALHDAAIATWDAKRRDPTPRPVSLVRWMGANGQSSKPGESSYDENGLPLVPGLIEVVTAESCKPGQRHEGLARYVGQVVVRGWRGEPGDPTRQASPIVWERAVDWIPYQRRTVGTPASPGFVSEESAFSFAAAEVLASLTGSASFPGGGDHILIEAPASTFLRLEMGPSERVRIAWAETYWSTAQQAGDSSLLAGVHIAPDVAAGRVVGQRAGRDAVTQAKRLFEGR
jgi:hypothetical protein